MTWKQRLREAAYVSPSGKRIVFSYENVRKDLTKKGSTFDFPDANGTYVQDLGHTGRRFPLRIFFHGRECDLEAELFEEVLLEIGPGTLEHPLYGTKKVVPLGSIVRRDDLKNAANQAIVEVIFWETIGVIYPLSQTDGLANANQAIGDFNKSLADQFLDFIGLGTASQRANFKNGYNSFLKRASNGLKTVASYTQEVEKTFNTVNDSINNGLDVLVNDPLTLAFQTSILIQAPARAISSIKARLDAFKNLGDSIFKGDDSNKRSSNDFHTANLFAASYVSGSILSALNEKYETKTDAIETAEALFQQFDDLRSWQDDQYSFLNQIDPGASYQALLNALALTAGYLVTISFGLGNEKRLVLDKERAIIDLVSQLYGNIENETIDFFIHSNNLSGSEIYPGVPAGTEVVYFV